MKIFVGTLYTIENEFEECVQAIKQQTYQNFQHFVFRDLPNKEAHDTLYQSFMDSADEFELMIKVDADMVIEDKYLFEKIVDFFQNRPYLKDLQLAVYDFFSDKLICGMHTYRNTVKWNNNNENLFVDRSYISLEETMTIRDYSDLTPAAIHCKNPSLFQSFHYGVHKALKAIQPGTSSWNQVQSSKHWNIIERTRNNFNIKQDLRLGFTILGAELALMGKIPPQHLDYCNPYLKNLFEVYHDLQLPQLKQQINNIQFNNFGYCPNTLRYKILSKQVSFIKIIPWIVGRKMQQFGYFLQQVSEEKR